MKFIVAALAVALMVQVSMAGPLARSKRSEKFVQDFQTMGNKGKNLIPAIERVFVATLPKIPQTAAYQKYRNDFQSILEDFNTFKIVPGSCFQKTFKLLSKAIGMIESFEDANAPAEAKKLHQLYNQSGGIALDIELTAWGILYASSNFDVESQRTTYAEEQRIDQIILAVC